MQLAGRNLRMLAVLAATAGAVALLIPFVKAPTGSEGTRSQASRGQGELNNGFNIPSLEQMCAGRAAAAEVIKSCESDESAAQEYVVAWMGLYGFLGASGIDTDQIALAASLDGSDPLSDRPGLDPASVPGVDASPDQFQSPAQVALYCLTRTDDWVLLHDCLAENDPGAGAGTGDLVSGASDTGAP